MLGDVCASAGVSALFAKRLAAVTHVPVAKITKARAGASALGDSIALLNRSYRFGAESGIGRLARLVNEGNAADAVALLESGVHKDLAWRAITPSSQGITRRDGDRTRASLSSSAGERDRTDFRAVQWFRVCRAARLLGVRRSTASSGLLEDEH